MLSGAFYEYLARPRQRPPIQIHSQENRRDFHTASVCVYVLVCFWQSKVSSPLVAAKGFQFDLMMPGQIQRVSV